MAQESDFEIEEKQLEPVLIAGLRMQGRYRDCGQGFGKLGRKFGSKMNGKPLMLIYDAEYKAEDADFEVCMPVRKGESTEEITVRELPGGKCVSLLYQGPYEGIGEAYTRLRGYIEERGYTVQLPCREVYIKGPGMIFKGNPKKYLTQLQFLVEKQQ